VHPYHDEPGVIEVHDVEEAVLIELNGVGGQTGGLFIGPVPTSFRVPVELTLISARNDGTSI
jgi:hypothetical protein